MIEPRRRDPRRSIAAVLVAFALLVATAPLAAGGRLEAAAISAAGAVSSRHVTAQRTARVVPGRLGIATNAATGAPGGSAAMRLGRISSATSGPGRTRATRPARLNLPHWLPLKSAGARTSDPPSVSSRRPTSVHSGGRSASQAVTVADAGTGIRSDFGFFGLSDADDSQLYADCSIFQLCEEPPDPSVAVDARSIVQAVNELILVVDRQSGDGRIMTTFDFFSLDNNQVQHADPRVLHDATRGRWLATEISADCDHSYLHVAVSSSDDPFGAWTVYRLVFPGRVIDFPGLGISDQLVVVGLNEFGADPDSPSCLQPADYAGASLVVIDWSQLESTATSLSVTATEPDPDLLTYRPAFSAGGDPVARAVVAILTDSETTANVGYATISGTNAGGDITISPAVDLTVTLGLPPFDSPPAPRQPGDPPTIVRAVDGQPTDAISAGGRLWFVATVPCKPAGDDTVRDCVRLVSLATGAAATNIGIATDTVLGETGMDLFMGGVGRAVDGTLYLVYSRSSPLDQIATWSTFKRPWDSDFQSPSLLIPPGGVYSGTRWGDWVILSSDPSRPDAVWQSNEVATDVGSWFTWLSRLTPAPVATPALQAGTVRINGGDALAGEDFVDLQLDSPPEVALTVVRVANVPTLRDGLLAGGQTLPVAADLPWSLAIDQPEGAPDGLRRVYVQWGDGLGHWSSVVSTQIVRDTTPPVSYAPEAPRIGASVLGRDGSVPIELRWPAAKDALSGVEGYDVEVATDGGDFESFGDPVASPVARGSVLPGHRYQWRVRAFDRLGNVSDGQDGIAYQVLAVDDTSPTLVYSTGWTRARAPSPFRQGVHTTSTGGASASFTFTGGGFAIVVTGGPGRGDLEVTVDSRQTTRISLDGPRISVRRIALFRDVAPGRHVVRITSVVDGRRVDLDAVILLR